MKSENVSIIGLGASGTSAARLALAKGETVYVSDLRTDARAAADADALRALGARVDLGTHDTARIAAAGLVVVSPGIPPDAPVLHTLRRGGVRWVSEPEFAVRFYQGPLIAVTGTNGKTTTAALTAHLLDASGIDAALGGNVGGGLAPTASELALREPAPAWYVLEMSSFQLADTDRFSPDIGVVTNLAPDHLDRYAGPREYYADKARLFRNASAKSRWILNGDDVEVLRLPGEAAGERVSFGRERGGNAAFVRDGVLTLAVPASAGGRGEDEPLVPEGALSLIGRHNTLNALAAALAARLAGASPSGIRAGLGSFLPLPHRLEPVAERDGVIWVNDSKATNVGAAIGAVASLDQPLILILGGKDKGEDFRPLARVLPGRVKKVVLYGEAAGRISDEFHEVLGDTLPIARGDRFDEAVAAAGASAEAGDAVLLAPACSSYDQFENYEARGRRFRELSGGEVRR